MSSVQRTFVDWSGKVTDNGLLVKRLVSRRPPSWAVTCVKCGCETTEPHSRIGYAECRNRACKLPERKRDRLDDERARARERERRALEEESHLAEQRMSAETADHTIKPSRPPVSEYVPMSDRDRHAIRARHEEERLEELQRQRPVREAEQRLKETHRRIAAMQRDTLTNPGLEDIDVFIADEVAGLSMPTSHAEQYNIIEWKKFGNAHPEFQPTDHNIGLLIDYHLRNHCGIYTSAMLESVYQGMKDAGVEFDGPPTPEPEPGIDYSTWKPVELHIAPPKKPQPVVYEGWDVETGEPRNYSTREIDRMSGDQMKRALRLYPDKLALPNVGPGPNGIREQTS